MHKESKVDWKIYIERDIEMSVLYLYLLTPTTTSSLESILACQSQTVK
jgi:hypothetical protein